MTISRLFWQQEMILELSSPDISLPVKPKPYPTSSSSSNSQIISPIVEWSSEIGYLENPMLRPLLLAPRNTNQYFSIWIYMSPQFKNISFPKTMDWPLTSLYSNPGIQFGCSASFHLNRRKRRTKNDFDISVTCDTPKPHITYIIPHTRVMDSSSEVIRLLWLISFLSFNKSVADIIHSQQRSNLKSLVQLFRLWFLLGIYTTLSWRLF